MNWTDKEDEVILEAVTKHSNTIIAWRYAQGSLSRSIGSIKARYARCMKTCGISNIINPQMEVIEEPSIPESKNQEVSIAAKLGKLVKIVKEYEEAKVELEKYSNIVKEFESKYQPMLDLLN